MAPHLQLQYRPSSHRIGHPVPTAPWLIPHPLLHAHNVTISVVHIRTEKSTTDALFKERFRQTE